MWKEKHSERKHGREPSRGVLHCLYNGHLEDFQSLKLPSSKGGQGTEWDDKVVLEGPPGWFLFVALAVLELTL